MKNRYAGYLGVSNRYLYNCIVYLFLAAIMIFLMQLGTVTGQISSNATNNLSDLRIKILDPQDMGKVPGSIEVSGNISGPLPRQLHMWLLVNPNLAPNQWWPQGGGEIEPDMLHKRWYGVAIIGGGEGDNGKKFDIAAVLVNNTDNQILNDWVNVTNANHNWPSILMPSSAIQKDRIKVIRSPN